MSRGDGRRITMDVGSHTVERGRGGRDRFMRAASTVRSGRRHMSHSGDGAEGLASDLVLADGAASAGCRLDLVTISIHGGVDIAGDLEWSGSMGDLITMADSRRCMAERASRILRTFTTFT